MPMHEEPTVWDKVNSDTTRSKDDLSEDVESSFVFEATV